MDSTGALLTVNAGSSSLKFDVFNSETLERQASAAVTNLGPTAQLTSAGDNRGVVANNHDQAAEVLTSWLEPQLAGGRIRAIGHRLVHGGPHYSQSVRLDSAIIKQLALLKPFDPEHLPAELGLIEKLGQTYPDAIQVACFDTGWHHDLPAVAQRLAIPRHYQEQGLRRYGFHGLSYRHLLTELERLEGAPPAGRLILAHLGSGVSLAAVRDGRPVDTTMGLTPASGVPMSSRSGDLDPGLIVYLLRSEGLSPDQLDALVNAKSGLLGVSSISADMKVLLDAQATQPAAAEAVELFCYQVKKAIGGLAATLGGVDQLVFTGGMGQSAPKVRAGICLELDYLGISLDQARNDNNEAIISAEGARVKVRVIPADEAMVIAADTQALTRDQDGVNGSAT